MLEAKALKPVTQYGKIIGYRLKDTKGNEMDVASSAIIDAMKNNKVKISNLTINSAGNLAMIKEDEVIKEAKPEQPKKDEVKPVTLSEARRIEVQKTGTTDNYGKLGRMNHLVKVLNEARKVYEQGKDEIMSNYEYDKLYDELEALEKELGTVLANSPTINIGYEVVSELPKETHKEVMMSLAKTKSTDDIKGFVGSKEAMIGWKLDGLTVVAYYRNGLIEKAVTRGNGTVGELVTPNFKQFKNVPHKIPYTGEVVIRGEALITYSSFNKINEKIPDGEKYKNPRNLASGSVRQLDSRVTASRNVLFKAFTLVNTEQIGIKTVEESYSWMKQQGFDVVDSVKVNSSNVEKAMEAFSNKVKSGTLDEPVDGLVITYNDIAYGKSLGATAKTPRHSMAFKWEDETAVTTLRDIEWSASKTGLLNPVAIFDPIDLEGSTVSRASVHNVSILVELGLGYGDKIKVYKANMIIPQISENLTRSATCEIPTECPVCGGMTEIHEDPNSGVYTLYCTNPECPAKGSRLLKHFVSRDAMNIDGISDSTLNKLMEYDIIDGSFASVYRIYKHPEIINIEGFGQTSFMNMVNAINKSRKVKLHNLIYALSIPNVGLQTAKVICQHFGNDLKKTVTASYLDLSSIEGIGDVIASNFFNYFHNKENVDAFIDLLGELDVIQEEVKKADANDPIFGKTFCVTGKVYIFPNRDAVKAIIESRGGKLTGSVSKSTDFLVTNDTTSGSRKNKAAAEFGIPILSEQEFIDKFNIEV